MFLEMNHYSFILKMTFVNPQTKCYNVFLTHILSVIYFYVFLKYILKHLLLNILQISWVIRSSRVSQGKELHGPLYGTSEDFLF